MSKKARIAKKLRRKMLAVWRNKVFKEEREEFIYNLLVFGLSFVATDKDGNKRSATIEEIEDLIVNCKIIKDEIESFELIEKNSICQDNTRKNLKSFKRIYF